MMKGNWPSRLMLSHFKMVHVSATATTTTTATVKFVPTFKIYSYFCITTLRPPQRATAPEPHGSGTIKSIWPSRRDLYFIVFFRSLYLQISCDCGFCESGTSANEYSETVLVFSGRCE